MFDLFNNKKLEGEIETLKGQVEEQSYKIRDQEQLTAHFSTPIFTIGFDGEKTPGEIGVAKDYRSDFNVLRIRSWQSFYESEITQTVIKKFVLWVIGNGLKLQSEPFEDILKDFKLNVDKEPLTKKIESYFKIWAESEDSDYTLRDNYMSLQGEAFFNAIVSGDCLSIRRVDKSGIVNIQLVDGSHIRTPFDTPKESGNNEIIEGVEKNKRGQHIAYHIQDEDGNFERVLVRDETGRKVVNLIYGIRYRINDDRGMPLIAAIETLKKLDRYKEAAVGSAEQRAKNPFFIKHELGGTGEGIADTGFEKKRVISSAGTDSFEVCERIEETTQNQVYNLTPGAELKSIDTKNDLYFKEFYDTNFIYVCSSIGIPPDVAKSLYDSSYSASRAAIKDWEHVLTVWRKRISNQDIKITYAYWLDVAVLSGLIKADGYSQALFENNKTVLNAYRNARFVGANVPHIDPEKEVRAVRLKLGDSEEAKNVPLMDVEDAIEQLGGKGDPKGILEQFTIETKDVKKEEVIPPSLPNAPIKKPTSKDD